MGVYKTYSFENEYEGMTNIRITDDYNYKVENEMPSDFYYHIKVTAGREKPPNSEQSYAALVEYTVLANGHTSGTSGECVFLPSDSGIVEDMAAGNIVRHNMTYSYTELVKQAYSDETYTATQSVTRTDFPYFGMNVHLMTAELDARYPFNIDIEFSTNMPIFDDGEIAEGYRNLTGQAREEYLDEYCVNYGDAPGEYSNETQDYYIYNTFDSATIDEFGNVTYTGGNPTGRFLIFKANSTPVMYWVNKGNSLELALIANDVVGSVYSSVNRYDVIQKQFNPSAWSTGLQYSNPWYNTFGSEYIPSGSATIGVTFEKHPDILIFDTKAKAEAYLRGEISEEEAWDWGSSGNPNIAENETGTKELVTEFGGNFSENVFSHDYLLSRTELADIGGKFFDTNILQALLEGLRVYGNNPMESVLSCLYFPFDLSTVCTASSVTDIYFGSYKMENVSAKKVSTREGYKELGSTFIKPTFRSWLDYAATHIFLYLPYIGFVELDVNKYLNKTLKIVYLIDLHSGECEVSLCADGLLMDTYSGQIGIKQPVTYNDLSTYFQSQITALRNGVMSAVGMPVAGGLAGAQAGANAGPYGAIAGAAIGATAGEIGGKASMMWTGYKFTKAKPPLFSKGGYSSEVGANMPQYAFLIFLYNEVEEPENLLQLYGKPSNKSGRIGDFNGFLSTNKVQLYCPRATEEEKAEILALLNTGIYI